DYSPDGGWYRWRVVAGSDKPGWSPARGNPGMVQAPRESGHWADVVDDQVDPVTVGLLEMAPCVGCGPVSADLLDLLTATPLSDHLEVNEEPVLLAGAGLAAAIVVKRQR